MGRCRKAADAGVLLALAAGLLLPPPAVAVRPSSRRAPQEALRGKQSAAFLAGHASSAAKAEGGEEPKTLADYCQGGPAKMQEGTRVEANWNDFGEYYPGKVGDINKDGTYDVKYDDGWTEKNVEAGDVKPVKGKKAEQKKSPDAACEVAKDVEDLKKRIKKTQEDISLWSAGRRAKMIRERDGERVADKATAATAAAAPVAAAPAASPAAAPPMTSKELEKLKKELDEVDEEIAQVKKDVEENEKTLKQGEGQDGKAADQPKVLTMDDLIAQYKERIKERRRELERLKARRRKQERQLAHLGAETVKLEDIEEEVKGINKDMEEIRAKRDKLEADGRLDAELRASIDKLLAQADKLADRLKSLLEAEALAEKQRKQLEAAKRKAEEMERELAAAEQSNDRAKVEDLKRKKAEADEDAKTIAKEVENDAEKSLKAADGVKDWLKSLGDSTATLDTGVVPSGNKWWRYRYEHTYVESVIMNCIAVLMLLWELFIKRVRYIVYHLSHQSNKDMLETGTMYIHWMEYLLGELASCLLVYLTIWLGSLWGIFDWFPIYLKGDESLHLPKKASEYQQIAYDICVVLIFTLILYFCLIFSVVHSSTAKLRKWAEYEVAQKASTSEEDEAETEEQDGDEASKEEEERGRGASPATRARSDVPAVGLPVNDRSGGPPRTSLQILRSMTVASTESDYTKLKDYFLEEMEERLPDFDASTFHFWQYLRLNVRATVDSLYGFGPLVWLPIIATFFVLTLMHRFAHIGYIRIMALFLVAAFVNLSIMLSVIVTVNKRLDESMSIKRSYNSDGKALPRSSSPVNSSVLKVAFALFGSYTLFFLCYGAARTVCQPWMWELHFWPVLVVASVTGLMVFYFLFKIAPIIPVFAATVSLPPYVDQATVRSLQETMAVDTLDAKEFVTN